jgi:inosine-uridine nucleoside N-ribohydrolase
MVATYSEVPRILLDTDPGVDDALALLYLHRHPAVELVGITTAAGNGPIDLVTKNTRYLADRFAMNVPIAQGAAASLRGAVHPPPPEIHGLNAMADLPIPDVAYPLDPRPAHQFIIDTVRAHPGEITLLAIAMLTNVARALIDDPGIAGLVKNVVVMGGAFSGNGGNASPVAEANIYGDAQAADIVFTAGWPVQIVGLDVTERIVMTPEYLAALRAHGTPEADFMWDVTRGYEAFYHQRDALGGIYAHDPAAAVCAVDDRPFTFSRGPVRVLHDGIAEGLTLQHRAGRMRPRAGAWTDAPPQAVATDVDPARVLALFAEPFAPRETT